ncbi:MAG: tRNA (adenosine(37)-N6)-threonylcarbamoyltransferase complex ATPase subunit type 1 TsaE [Marinicella sp.]
MQNSKKYNIQTLTELAQAADTFSRQFSAGDVIYLEGDLGTGKTTFTQYLLAKCGVQGHVKSPTYTLYETYQSSDHKFIHMDLYRLTDPEELYFLGIEELLDGKQVMLIEWPEKGQGVLPKPDWILSFILENLNRTLTITSN